jgi:hypothetical protein
MRVVNVKELKARLSAYLREKRQTPQCPVIDQFVHQWTQWSCDVHKSPRITRTFAWPASPTSGSTTHTSATLRSQMREAMRRIFASRAA